MEVVYGVNVKGRFDVSLINLKFTFTLWKQAVCCVDVRVVVVSTNNMLQNK